MGGAVIPLSLYAFKTRREKKNFCLLREQTHDSLASSHSVLLHLQGTFVLPCKLEKSATVLVWIDFRLGCVYYLSRKMPLAAIAVCAIRHKTLLQVSYISCQRNNEVRFIQMPFRLHSSRPIETPLLLQTCYNWRSLCSSWNEIRWLCSVVLSYISLWRCVLNKVIYWAPFWNVDISTL